MQNSIILKNNQHTLELNLTGAVSKHEKIHEIVYQDLDYELVLNLAELAESDIIQAEVLLNNCDSLWKEYIIKGHDITTIEFTNQKGFSLLFGLAQFSVILTFSDGTEKIMFSEFLSVAVNDYNREVQDSLGEMINVILQKQSIFLYKNQFIIDREKKSLYQNPKLNKEMNLIDRILYTYTMNFPYFKSGLKYRMESSAKIDNFEKLTRINPQTINYIVSHPEQLQQVNYKTGIYIQGYNFQPRKTLVSTGYEDSNIYENRVIIGFLKYIKVYLQMKCALAQEILNENSYGIEKKTNLKKGYILSEEIIKSYITANLNIYISELEEKLKEIKKIYMQYKRVFTCEEESINRVPKATTIFQNVHYYRNIFIEINGWFSFGEYDLSEEKRILNFVTADQIYEYYCLLSIFESLNELGYSEDISKRRSYKYELNSKYFKDTSEDNTFVFSNGDTEIFVYSQPVIYSQNSNTTNGITLFRTDRSYFRPDFVIKYVTHKNVSNYAILDAKWRREKTIDFKDMVYKYVYSISDVSDNNGKKFMWILKGKSDVEKSKIYRHQNGALSKTKGREFMNTTGIVEVTPRSGIRNLTDILSIFLMQ
ncbi:MAG: nuclease domain-containing protein [Turicibacter sp.]|nr:nuclease domain-containing protein [Turicibacter sp.]